MSQENNTAISISLQQTTFNKAQRFSGTGLIILTLSKPFRETSTPEEQIISSLYPEINSVGYHNRITSPLIQRVSLWLCSPVSYFLFYLDGETFPVMSHWLFVVRCFSALPPSWWRWELHKASIVEQSTAHCDVRLVEELYLYFILMFYLQGWLTCCQIT